MTQKKDVDMITGAYINHVINYGEYWQKMELLVGWNLMILGLLDGNVKVKSNGQNNETKPSC